VNHLGLVEGLEGFGDVKKNGGEVALCEVGKTLLPVLIDTTATRL
jgi:hypothetical protein